MNIKQFIMTLLATFGCFTLSISALPTLPVAKGLAIAGGAAIAQAGVNDITNSVKHKEYAIAAEQGALLFGGAAALKTMGLYGTLHNDALKASIPPSTNSTIHFVSRATDLFMQTLRIGGRTILLFPAVLIGYNYLSIPAAQAWDNELKPAFNNAWNKNIKPALRQGLFEATTQSNVIACESPKDTPTEPTQAEREATERKVLWAKIGSKFSMIPASMKAKYHQMAQDATIDRKMLIGNK